MKTIFTFLVISIILCSGLKWSNNKEIKGSGILQTEQRELKNFKGVHTTRSIQVLLSQGENVSVKVEADDNLLPLITTEVDGDVLNITLPPKTTIKTKNDMTVYITVPEINYLHATTSGEIKGATFWKCTNLNLTTSTSGEIVLDAEATSVQAKASTSSEIELNIQANSIEAASSTSGEIKLKGTTGTLNATASTSGTIKAPQLVAQSVTATASTSGSINVQAIQNLSGTASTSGSIRYSGNPKVNQSNTSTAGSITRVR